MMSEMDGMTESVVRQLRMNSWQHEGQSGKMTSSEHHKISYTGGDLKNHPIPTPITMGRIEVRIQHEYVLLNSPEYGKNGTRWYSLMLAECCWR